MPSDMDTDGAGNDPVKAKRMAVLDEVEELRRDAKVETGQELDYIETNSNSVEDDLLNDGEYDYSVRVALQQLTLAVEQAEGGQKTTVERIEKYRAQLASKAELPSPNQLER